VQQASGWTWNLWAMSAVARAPRDEADARQTMITEAVARAYERMGRRVRPGVHMGGTSLRRAMEEALAENSGLLLLFAPTGGMVGVSHDILGNVPSAPRQPRKPSLTITNSSGHTTALSTRPCRPPEVSHTMRSGVM
jgi:hypothetical protein